MALRVLGSSEQRTNSSLDTSAPFCPRHERSYLLVRLLLLTRIQVFCLLICTQLCLAKGPCTIPENLGVGLDMKGYLVQKCLSLKLELLCARPSAIYVTAPDSRSNPMRHMLLFRVYMDSFVHSQKSILDIYCITLTKLGVCLKYKHRVQQERKA